MPNKWKTMSFRLPARAYKDLKIKLIEQESTFQNLIESILIRYLNDKLVINNQYDSVNKTLLNKTLTFRLEKKYYKKIKLKLITKEKSFQEVAEKLILAYLDGNLEVKE